MDKRQSFANNSHALYQSTQSESSIFSTQSSSEAVWNTFVLEHQRDSEIFTQLQELNKDVDTTAEFVCGANEIICTTVPAIAILAILCCFHVTEIFMGVRYLEDCPVEPRIPVFLFVGGCFWLLKLVHMLYTYVKMRRHADHGGEVENASSHRAVQIVDLVLDVFLLVWQVMGTIWTVGVWYPYFEAPLHEPNNWCEETCYLFSMATVCLFGIVLVLRGCCQGWLVICFKYSSLFRS